jgi:cytochrome c oxidase subunit 3
VTAQALPAVVRGQTNRVLLVALIATVMMLFTAFAAAYMERAAASGWGKIELPRILWLNTGVLALSSIAAELARRGRARWALPLALLLGVLFLGGQALAWSDLRARGVFLPSSPYASFFYLLTGIHAVHVAAALAALGLALRRTRILGVAVAFWHFMGALWIYVLLTLTVLG